jgi:F420-dependent oxidoreductase-like protein
MPERTIGVAATGGDSNQVIATIQDLERRGVNAAWLSAGGGLDSLTLFAAAAATTERILLGTCITTTWSRHPITAIQQAQVVGQLAPGRFRYGVGTGHAKSIEGMFGIDFNSPLSHLREYLTLSRALLDKGAVEFEGSYYRGSSKLMAPMPEIPVMAAALRPKAYEVCGELADGAISWVSPGVYLRDVALPALRKGADRAKRQAPPLIAHVPICVSEDFDAVCDAARNQLAIYPRSPFYQQMFAAAGFPEAGETETWSEGMVEGVVFSGNEGQVTSRINELFDWGISEIIVSVVTVGNDTAASRERTLGLLASLS